MKKVDFEKTWGIRCNDLAEMEGVTPEAIRMRVRNFGTPFKRRKKTTKWEKKYGKTIYQLALDRELHPQTLARREYLFGDIDHETVYNHPNAGQVLNDKGLHWTVNPKMFYIRPEATFMPQYDDNLPDPIPFGKDED